MNTKNHITDPEGRDRHLTVEQHSAITRTATETENGLMPEGILYGIIYFNSPRSATSFGRKGMQAFDDKYYYICFEENAWRRKRLEEF
jgi:hypothetical protein